MAAWISASSICTLAVTSSSWWSKISAGWKYEKDTKEAESALCHERNPLNTWNILPLVPFLSSNPFVHQAKSVLWHLEGRRLAALRLTLGTFAFGSPGSVPSRTQGWFAALGRCVSEQGKLFDVLQCVFVYADKYLYLSARWGFLF